MSHMPEAAIAYHEAGHCVAACLARKRFKAVTIIPDGDTLGKCSTTAWKNYHPDYDANRRTIQRVKADIFVSLAGPIAELKFTGDEEPVLCSDYNDALSATSYLCGSNEQTEAYVNYVWKVTESVISLDWNWKAVEAVAKSLLQRQTIGYKEARRLVKEPQPLGVIQPIYFI